MPSLQVRDVPIALYNKLKDEADLKHRSLTQQAVITLAKGLDVQLDAKERRRALFKKIEAMELPPGTENLPDPVDLIREDRDR